MNDPNENTEGSMRMLRRGTRKVCGRGALFVLAVLAMVLCGCGSSGAGKVGKRGGGNATLFLKCAARINEGLVVTVDLVQTSEQEAQQIRQLGSEWFYSELRKQVASRSQTIAVTGGCNEAIRVMGRRGYEVLAILADYRSQGGSIPEATMHFREWGEWRGKKLVVSLNEGDLKVERVGS